jgi:uncharacterized protein
MLKSVIVVAALVAATGAHAQTKKELVQKVVQLQQPAIEGLARSIAGQTSGQVLQAAGQALQRVPADKREQTAQAIRADVQKFYNEAEPVLREHALKIAHATLGPTLEEKFSEDELKQVIAWLESPTAKKFQEIGPELQKDLGEKLVAETRPAIEPKLKALEQTLVKQLGVEPASSAPKAATPPKK